MTFPKYFRFRAGKCTPCSKVDFYGAKVLSGEPTGDYLTRIGFRQYLFGADDESWVNEVWYNDDDIYLIVLTIDCCDYRRFRIEGTIEFMNFVRDYLNPMVEPCLSV
jgi:hypothetical protein